MTRTARRRWSRELETEVDGIALGSSGPVLMHGYEPPAGGKWVDNVIPGKLGAIDRSSGETLWNAPCEIGYGRGFGAGFGADNDVIVMGPSTQGHRIVRMALDSGVLIDLKDIEPFDLALVGPDVCVCVTPQRVFAILTSEMLEVWEYKKKGYRYHLIAREGDDVLVVCTHEKSRRQGVLCLDAERGKLKKDLLEPVPTLIHAIATQPGVALLVVENVQEVISREVYLEHLMKRLGEDPDAEVEENPRGLSLVALSLDPATWGRALWFETLSQESADELPDLTIDTDNGKLYVARGAVLDVRDCLTGRVLGQLTIPGLDEHVSWKVSQGAGLLAEETRVSIFEVPD